MRIKGNAAKYGKIPINDSNRCPSNLTIIAIHVYCRGAGYLASPIPPGCKQFVSLLFLPGAALRNFSEVVATHIQPRPKGITSWQAMVAKAASKWSNNHSTHNLRPRTKNLKPNPPASEWIAVPCPS